MPPRHYPEAQPSEPGDSLPALNEGYGYALGNQPETSDTPEQWAELYNPTVAAVLETYHRDDSATLFGAVGDLDNLGHHVAFYGRPAAENLVDLYNQAIRNTTHAWGAGQGDDLRALTFVPSGEEVLILGATSNPEAAQQFMDGLRGDVMEYMSSQSILQIGDTAASFGSLVFDDRYDHLIEAFLDSRTALDPEAAPRSYFAVLEHVRSDMADALDAQKFAAMLPGQPEAAGALRRLAWNGMIGYKADTRGLIIELHQLLENEEYRPHIEALLTELNGWRPGIPHDSRDRVASHLARMNLSRPTDDT